MLIIESRFLAAASWRYFQRVKKVCKELDNNETALRQQPTHVRDEKMQKKKKILTQSSRPLHTRTHLKTVKKNSRIYKIHR